MSSEASGSRTSLEFFEAMSVNCLYCL
jgi:hypothetical protein